MKSKREQGFIEKIVRAIVKKYLPGFYLAHKPPKGKPRNKTVKVEGAIS
jgi:hypothetical protein